MPIICIPISSIHVIARGLYLISSLALSSILYWNSRDKQVYIVLPAEDLDHKPGREGEKESRIQMNRGNERGKGR